MIPFHLICSILAVEILAINIHNNKKNKGIKVDNKEIKLAMYADDTTAILKDIASAKVVLKLLKQFSKCSGLSINIDKTEALWIGKDRSNKDTPLGISWPKQPIKLLGLYIGHNEKDLEVSNFRHQINNIKIIYYKHMV